VLVLYFFDFIFDPSIFKCVSLFCYFFVVWASAPLVLSVRHYQNYGDEDLIRKSLPHHIKWLDFLDKYFDEGMKEKKYDDELETYHAPLSGLGDWLAMRGRDTFLTHTGFYMASGRCVAYMAHVLGEKNTEDRGMALANTIRDRISYLYLKVRTSQKHFKLQIVIFSN